MPGIEIQKSKWGLHRKFLMRIYEWSYPVIFIRSTLRHSFAYTEGMGRIMDAWYKKIRITCFHSTVQIAMPTYIYRISSNKGNSSVRIRSILRDFLYDIPKGKLPYTTSCSSGLAVIWVCRVVIVWMASYGIHIGLTNYVPEFAMIIIVSFLEFLYCRSFESRSFQCFLIDSFLVATGTIFGCRSKCNIW